MPPGAFQAQGAVNQDRLTPEPLADLPLQLHGVVGIDHHHVTADGPLQRIRLSQRHQPPPVQHTHPVTPLRLLDEMGREQNGDVLLLA